MSSQSHDLHRALLRPFIIYTLRAAGFHSTKPSVLDTLVNIAERYLMLLASSTAKHALNSHNDLNPTLSDVRMAMVDCGVLTPLKGSAEQEWTELMRRAADELADDVPLGAGRQRVIAEKRKREEEDIQDVRSFLRWFGGPQHAEIRRIAGMAPEVGGQGTTAVGVGGGVVHAEDFLERLKKRHSKTGDDTRLQGTVLGKAMEENGNGKGIVVEGGPVQSLREWKPLMVDGEARKGSMIESGDAMVT